MTTLEAKAETFESALEPVRKLDIPMGHFLQAHPDLAKPIPLSRLREVLRSAKDVDDLSNLWKIYEAYGFLERHEDHKGNYATEREVIWSRIDELVGELIQKPEHKNLADSCRLYGFAPEGSESDTATFNEMSSQAEQLRPAMAMLDLQKAEKYFPTDSKTKNRLEQLIRKKVLDGIRLVTKERNIFSWLDAANSGLTHLDRYTTLKRIINSSVEYEHQEEKVEILYMAVKALQKCRPKDVDRSDDVAQDQFERHLKLEVDTWESIIGMTSHKAYLFEAIEALGETERDAHWSTVLAKGINMLFERFGNADIENLEKAEVHYRQHWDYWGEDFKEVTASLEKGYETLLKRAMLPEFPKMVYDKFKDDKPGDWKRQVMLAAVRRLYELSQSK